MCGGGCWQVKLCRMMAAGEGRAGQSCWPRRQLGVHDPGLNQRALWTDAPYAGKLTPASCSQGVQWLLQTVVRDKLWTLREEAQGSQRCLDVGIQRIKLARPRQGNLPTGEGLPAFPLSVVNEDRPCAEQTFLTPTSTAWRRSPNRAAGRCELSPPAVQGDLFLAQLVPAGSTTL